MKRFYFFLGLILFIDVLGFSNQTNYLVFQGAAEFSKGTMNNTQVDSYGNLLLSPHTKEIVNTKNLLVQAVALAGKKGFYFVTAQEPELYYYDLSKEKSQLIYTAKGLAITAMVTTKQGLYFVESPSNNLYFLSFKDISKNQEEIKPHLMARLKNVNYVWQLVISGENLYIATGAKAYVYQLNIHDKNSKLKIIFEAKEENHLISMVLSGSKLYLGGEGTGNLYELDLNNDRSKILYKTYEGEISSILIEGKNIYFTTSNKIPKRSDTRFDYTDTFIKQDFQYKMGVSNLLNSNTPLDKAVKLAQGVDPNTELFVKNSLYFYNESGIQKLITLDNSSLNSVTRKNKDELLIGASNGKILRYKESSRLLSFYSSIPDEDVMGIFFLDHKGFVFSANLGKIYTFSSQMPSEGEYVSNILSLGGQAVLGRMIIKAEKNHLGTLEVFIRGGGTKEVDHNWSDWEGPFLPDKDEERPKIKNSRFIQYKVKISGKNEQSPLLSSITMPYLVENSQPSISFFNVFYDRSNQNVPPYMLSFQWNATDADKDNILFKVLFKEKKDVAWQTLGEVIGQNKLILDSRNIPDGVYQFKLQASDELDNDSSRASYDEQKSQWVVIDNTPPEIKVSDVSVSGNKVIVKGFFQDRFSIIFKAYYRIGLMGNESWHFIAPDERIYDNKIAHFTLNLDKKDLKDSVENLVFIRTIDMNLNQRIEKIKLNSQGKWIKTDKD